MVFTWDRRIGDAFWLTRDYLPAFKRLPGMAIEEIAHYLGGARIVPVPIPWDCRDGSTTPSGAGPRRTSMTGCAPGISVFARIANRETAKMAARLRADLASGTWQQRNAHLLGLEEIDLGYRLFVAELPEVPDR